MSFFGFHLHVRFPSHSRSHFPPLAPGIIWFIRHPLLQFVCCLATLTGHQLVPVRRRRHANTRRQQRRLKTNEDSQFGSFLAYSQGYNGRFRIASHPVTRRRICTRRNTRRQGDSKGQTHVSYLAGRVGWCGVNPLLWIKETCPTVCEREAAICPRSPPRPKISPSHTCAHKRGLAAMNGGPKCSNKAREQNSAPVCARPICLNRPPVCSVSLRASKGILNTMALFTLTQTCCSRYLFDLCGLSA